MRLQIAFILIAFTLLASCRDSKQETLVAAKTSDGLDRTILPIKEPIAATSSELDVRNAKMPAQFNLQAPDGAPNVILVLVDDLGFAGTSTFGGPVPTPTFDKIASEGIYYNNFHTAAVCSPTRAALKSGRNHHVNNMGSIIETGTGFPGNTGRVPQNVAPLAEILRLNGYSTGAFGKWHETAASEATNTANLDRWPIHQGFEKFYGFLGGETNQWAPFVYDGTVPVELPADPKYHFMTDMTNQSIAWMKYQKALNPNKPFFMYWAPGAVHAPHHVPQTYIDKWKGKFDAGWDAMRQQILDRQIKLGIVPPGTKLAPKPEAIPNWNTLSSDQKRLYTKQVEVFAAYIEMMDYELGRLMDAVDQVEQTENTMVILVYGDNGTSAEGGANGMYSEMTYFNGVQETVPNMLKKIDKWGGPETYPHQAAGWAVMFDAPYQWTKQISSDHGGTKVGMAIRWPKGIKAKGELRKQFTHVIDVAPTILEAAGLPEPKIVNGIEQRPMDGTSMLYTFADANAKERHTTQYFEMFGNRAIYHEGWYARTIHRAPWESTPRRPLKDDIWELYEVANDFSLIHDLSANYPEKLKELQELFMKEAEKNYALPIDDRLFERLIAANVGRTDLMAGRNSLTLAEGMTGMSENVFLNVKNRSVTITANIEIPQGTTGNGIIIAQGGRFGGWALYMKDGIVAYDYNFLGMERYTVSSPQKMKAGMYTVKFDFDYDGGGVGKGGKGTIFIDGKKVSEGRITRTQPGLFSADETADVGIDLATPIVERIGAEHRSKFNGHIPKVTVEIGASKLTADEAKKESELSEKEAEVRD
jgi:arylsulfatase A-like enzyme